MNSIACFIAVAFVAAVASSASVGTSQQLLGKNILHTLTEETSLNAPSELGRWKKSAYGGASVPSVPCPKNYLFSCQPNVAPVPCSPHGYGSAGAYSAPVPTYAVPQTHQGIPQELIAPSHNIHQYWY